MLLSGYQRQVKCPCIEELCRSILESKDSGLTGGPEDLDGSRTASLDMRTC